MVWCDLEPIRSSVAKLPSFDTHSMRCAKSEITFLLPLQVSVLLTEMYLIIAVRAPSKLVVTIIATTAILGRAFEGLIQGKRAVAGAAASFSRKEAYRRSIANEN